jgi:hypothetical protein
MVSQALWLKMTVASESPAAGFSCQRSYDLPLMKSQQTHPRRTLVITIGHDITSSVLSDARLLGMSFDVFDNFHVPRFVHAPLSWAPELF